MSGVSDWFVFGEDTSHYCGGMTDEKKNNKPAGTQVEMTKWFVPAPLDKETGVPKCTACGESPKDGELRTTIEIEVKDGN